MRWIVVLDKSLEGEFLSTDSATLYSSFQPTGTIYSRGSVLKRIMRWYSPPEQIRLSENIFSTTEFPDEISRLPGVSIYESTKIHNEVIETPSGPSAASSDPVNWGINREFLHLLHSQGITGHGVKVGIIDSGIDASHHAFKTMADENRIRAFAAFNEKGEKTSEDWRASDSYSSNHGTHCAGTISGENLGDATIGLAPGIELYVAKIIDHANDFTTDNFTSALNWMSKWSCDIVSLSLGWEGKRSVWAMPIKKLIDAGTLVICASGNDYKSSTKSPALSPANYPFQPVEPSKGGLVSVGAIRANSQIWDRSGGWAFSWLQSEWPLQTDQLDALVPTLVGPGHAIYSTVPGDSYKKLSGTSMATPYVAGVCALLLDKGRKDGLNLSIAEILNDRQQFLIDGGSPGFDTRFGNGAIDLRNFLEIFDF